MTDKMMERKKLDKKMEDLGKKFGLVVKDVVTPVLEKMMKDKKKEMK